MEELDPMTAVTVGADRLMTVGGLYRLDEFGRTTGYIRRYVDSKFYGFISNDEMAMAVDGAHPADIFFTAEHCAGTMVISQGSRVSFRLVQIKTRSNGFKNRAMEIVPLIPRPTLIIPTPMYKTIRPATIAPQLDPPPLTDSEAV